MRLASFLRNASCVFSEKCDLDGVLDLVWDAGMVRLPRLVSYACLYTTQNAVLTAIENIVAPKNELAIRSINASSGRDAASVTANSERGERAGVNVPFENASENDNIQHVSNVNDETRQNIPDEVSELSVPETRFDRQPHTHHSNANSYAL